MSKKPVTTNCARLIACVNIAPGFPITAKLWAWPFCVAHMPAVRIKLGLSMAAGFGAAGGNVVSGAATGCRGLAFVIMTNETPVIRYIRPFCGAAVHCNAYCRILPFQTLH